MATGDIHKFGTLYVNNTKILNPTRPWATGRTVNGNLSELGLGNCHDYKEAGKGSIEVKNSDSDEAYKIKWVEVDFTSYKLFVCDRNILCNVCYDDLDLYGLINKKITIDGKQYILRLPDGGYSKRIDGDSYSGANPSFNEWDSIVCNELGFNELPSGRVEDSNNTLVTLEEFNAPLNKLWNYAEMGSHCFNFSSTHPTTGVKRNTLRGHRRNAKYFDDYNRDIPLPSFGYRPILVLKKESINLPTDTSLSEVESKVYGISKEICHNRSKLYASIKEKGIEIPVHESKMSSLISKIGDIEIAKVYSAGTNWIINFKAGYDYISNRVRGSSYTKILEIPCNFKGSIRFDSHAKYGTNWGYLKIELTNNSDIVKSTKEFEISSSSDVTYSYDIGDFFFNAMWIRFGIS